MFPTAALQATAIQWSLRTIISLSPTCLGPLLLFSTSGHSFSPLCLLLPPPFFCLCPRWCDWLFFFFNHSESFSSVASIWWWNPSCTCNSILEYVLLWVVLILVPVSVSFCTALVISPAHCLSASPPSLSLSLLLSLFLSFYATEPSIFSAPHSHIQAHNMDTYPLAQWYYTISICIKFVYFALSLLFSCTLLKMLFCICLFPNDPDMKPPSRPFLISIHFQFCSVI